MHKTSISFTHRIIEYLNSIARRYALAVPSRKTAVKLVTGPLSLPSPASSTKTTPARAASSILRGTIDPWRAVREYFAAPRDCRGTDSSVGEPKMPLHIFPTLPFLCLPLLPPTVPLLTFAAPGNFSSQLLAIFNPDANRRVPMAKLKPSAPLPPSIFSSFPSRRLPPLAGKYF